MIASPLFNFLPRDVTGAGHAFLVYTSLTQVLGYRRGDFPVTEDQSERIFTLPIHQYLREDQIRTVAETINEFFA